MASAGDKILGNYKYGNTKLYDQVLSGGGTAVFFRAAYLSVSLTSTVWSKLVYFYVRVSFGGPWKHIASSTSSASFHADWYFRDLDATAYPSWKIVNAKAGLEQPTLTVYGSSFGRPGEKIYYYHGPAYSTSELIHGYKVNTGLLITAGRADHVCGG